MNFVLGEFESYISDPLCISAIPLLILNPSPVPLPTSFVVKNGCINFATTEGGMPAPLSVTVVLHKVKWYPRE